MPTNRRRRPNIPIPESDLEGWGYVPTKRWYVKATRDIYRAGGRLARKGDQLHVAVEDGRVFFHRQELYPYEFEGLILL